MSDRHIALYRPLMDYIEFWERLRRRSIPLISKVAHPGIQYISPYHNLQGIEIFSEHVEERFERFERMKFQCNNYGWAERGQDNVAYIHWDIIAQRKEQEFNLSGISELTFSKECTVLLHVDYWNTTENIFEEPTIFKKILNKLSALESPER